MKTYENFLDWAANKGLQFPCSAWEFVARAIEFARNGGAVDEVLVDVLCHQGIGSNWREEN